MGCTKVSFLSVILHYLYITQNSTVGFPSGTGRGVLYCQCSRHKWHGFIPWIRKMPWRRAWQPAPALLPGESHGQEPGGLQSVESQRVELRLKQLSTHAQNSTKYLYYYSKCYHLGKLSDRYTGSFYIISYNGTWIIMYNYMYNYLKIKS